VKNDRKDFASRIFAFLLAGAGLLVLVILGLPRLSIADDYYFGTSIRIPSCGAALLRDPLSATNADIAGAANESNEAGSSDRCVGSDKRADYARP
jgi:hypothetical protein